MKTRVLWQNCVIAAVGCLASGHAHAQSTVDCSSVAEDMTRLKCYDEQAARQKKQVAMPPTVASPATAPAPAAATSPATAAQSTAPASPAAAARPTTPATSPAPSAAATTPTPARPSSTANDFGLDAEIIRKRQAAANPDLPKEPDQIVARVQSVTTKPRGAFRITLDDGQVWEETQHSSSNFPPDVGETVTIKRGLLGSYFLSHSAGLALRVKRIH